MKWNKFSDIMPRRETDKPHYSVDVVINQKRGSQFVGYIDYDTGVVYGTFDLTVKELISNGDTWSYVHKDTYDGIPIDQE